MSATGNICSSAAWIILTVIVVLWVITYRRYCFYRRSARALRQGTDNLKNRLLATEKLLQNLAQLGKMRYFIISPRTITATLQGCEQNDPRLEFKPPEVYIKKMHPADRQEFLEKWQKLLSGEIEQYQTSYTIYNNGVPNRYRELTQCITNPDTGQRQILIAEMDISELEQQNRDLADADLILRMLFHNMPGYIFTKNVGGDFHYVLASESFAKLFNRTPEEFKTLTDFDLFPHDTACKVRAGNLEIMRSKEIDDREWFVTTQEGRMLAMRVMTQTINRTDGSSFILGCGVDITRQEQVARTLRRRNKELRMMLHNHPSPVILLDRQLRIVNHSKSLTGTIEQLAGTEHRHCFCMQLGCKLSEPPADCPVLQCLQQNQSQRSTGLPHQCIAGELSKYLPFREDSFVPIQDQDGVLSYACLYLKPVDDKKVENNI